MYCPEFKPWDLLTSLALKLLNTESLLCSITSPNLLEYYKRLTNELPLQPLFP